MNVFVLFRIEINILQSEVDSTTLICLFSLCTKSAEFCDDRVCLILWKRDIGETGKQLFAANVVFQKLSLLSSSLCF